MEPRIEYLSDSSIDAALDAELRNLLTTCFKKPQDVIFKTQRFFREPYPNRWVIRDDSGAIIAHVGLHEKNVLTEEQTTFPVGGVCEVCVHPDYRGRGYVKLMLAEVHRWMQEREFPFSMLFGHPDIYSSSGYSPVRNLVRGGDKEGWKPVRCMVKVMGNTLWPTGQVRLPGPKF